MNAIVIAIVIIIWQYHNFSFNLLKHCIFDVILFWYYLLLFHVKQRSLKSRYSYFNRICFGRYRTYMSFLQTAYTTCPRSSNWPHICFTSKQRGMSNRWHNYVRESFAKYIRDEAHISLRGGGWCNSMSDNDAIRMRMMC